MEERVFSSRESDLKALKKRFKNLSYIAAILCSLGLATCFYALRIEIIKSKDSSYSAFCDINSYISCTKVFFSKYGKGFGLLPEGSIFNQPNTVYGILFFSSQMILLLFHRKALMIDAKLFLSILANLGNVYLAYILYFVLRDFCLVCVAFYLINFFLLIVNHKHYMCKNKILRLLAAKKKKSN